mmetsp:Transcript_34041/g.41165  ORF Transcript_34041/g.41165 Transcript_34041/m.41165 type:complete len:90 (+) Transcript_34041:377-646(+)
MHTHLSYPLPLRGHACIPATTLQTLVDSWNDAKPSPKSHHLDNFFLVIKLLTASSRLPWIWITSTLNFDGAICSMHLMQAKGMRYEVPG